MKTILQDVSTRLPYLSPECDILSVKTEGIICDSGFGGNSVDPGISDDWGDLPAPLFF